MQQKRFDITFVSQKEYVNPQDPDWYAEQILLEDQLLRDSLNKLGLNVHITHWDDPTFDWSQTRVTLIRATWDYSGRIGEFMRWLDDVNDKCQLLNPFETIKWNLDKHYLLDLAEKGFNIPETYIVEKGDSRSVDDICQHTGWESFVLKPTVSGGGRHTYLCNAAEAAHYQPLYSELIKQESMIFQLYQSQITTKGEITLVCFGGRYSHAIRKFAKEGEFRVQDDFGGRVEEYTPSYSEIEYAEHVMRTIDPTPIYGRVDMMWNNENELCVSELELIEPELWMRFKETASLSFAQAIDKRVFLA